MMCGLASTLTDRAGTVAWLNPAWASCFNGALQLMLKQGGVKVEQTPEVEVTMSLNKGDDGLFLTATITATVFGVDQATADARTHRRGLYRWQSLRQPRLLPAGHSRFSYNGRYDRHSRPADQRRRSSTLSRSSRYCPHHTDCTGNR